MATFTNFATLSYNGGTTTSNIVTGELLEILSASKAAVVNDYTARDDVTFVVSLINSGAAAVTGVSVTDDLGGYAFGEGTVYPLAYTEGSLRYYVNGVLQTAPTVAGGPPLVISGINIPAGGNVLLIYEATVTEFAPLAADSSVTNTVVITGGDLSSQITASETITPENRADLTVNKSISPAVIAENGQLSYTFVVENQGNTEAVTTDNAVLTDVFDPILDPISVTYNGTLWVEGTNYTYDTATGEFASLPGQITVPAATYTQNTDGTWTVVPGVSVIVISGTV